MHASCLNKWRNKVVQSRSPDKCEICKKTFKSGSYKNEYKLRISASALSLLDQVIVIEGIIIASLNLVGNHLRIPNMQECQKSLAPKHLIGPAEFAMLILLTSFFTCVLYAIICDSKILTEKLTEKMEALQKYCVKHPARIRYLIIFVNVIIYFLGNLIVGMYYSRDLPSFEGLEECSRLDYRTYVEYVYYVRANGPYYGYKIFIIGLCAVIMSAEIMALIIIGMMNLCFERVKTYTYTTPIENVND